MSSAQDAVKATVCFNGCQSLNVWRQNTLIMSGTLLEHVFVLCPCLDATSVLIINIIVIFIISLTTLKHVKKESIRKLSNLIFSGQKPCTKIN